MATVCREEEADLVIMGDLIPSDPGGSQYRELLRALAAELGIAERVHFLGWRDDALEVMASCDVFVSASHAEGLPGAVREAMGLGKAIVATDAGGTAEALGDTGFVVPCGDEKVLADKILHLLRCDSLRKSMGQAARIRLRTLFSTDQLAKNYSNLISELYQCKGIRV
jgi:glycosyltransferase involved in cell wall biosynthesis